MLWLSKNVINNYFEIKHGNYGFLITIAYLNS
jgi:hypothetical protein